MTAINRWTLNFQNFQNFQSMGLDPLLGMDQSVYGAFPYPSDGESYTAVTLHDLGNGTIALQYPGSSFHPAVFASVRDDYGFRVQFQDPQGNWITEITARETFQATVTGDGYFALYSPTFSRYVTVDSEPDTNADDCFPLRATTDDITQAARFTATGLDRPSVFDFLQVNKNASGLSFAGVNLSNVDLSGDNDLSGCDFREVAQGSLSGCVLDGTNLQYASFAGLHLDGLSISNADCAFADFSGCDFTSFVPATPPPVLANADLTGAVISAGNSWSGANMPGAVLAEATLTGCDLSGAATNLAGTNFSGVGVRLFEPAYQGGGIGADNLMDRVIAFDGNSSGNLDHLVCYIPGAGSVIIVRKNADGTFDTVYSQGDPGNGIGGYKLDNPADRIIAYDYLGTGHLDHLVCYRPGTGIVWILEKGTDQNNNLTFDKVWPQANTDSTSGIGGYNLQDPADRIIAFDYYGTGHLDHLVCYRRGTGTIWILEKTTDQNSNVTFNPLFQSAGGIGPDNTMDRIIAFDYTGTGHLDHLVCYIPGKGSVIIIRKKSDGTFDAPYFQGAPGDGIGGYKLDNPADRIIAYDYCGTGHLDHLICYRPGTGKIWILEKGIDQNNNVTFSPVYRHFGIGGYDMAVLADRIIAYDYAGIGHPDHLVCYRPNTSTIWVIQSSAAGPATLERCNLTGANLSGTQLAGAKLAGVNLTGANLAGTNFTGTDLTEVTFSSPLITSTDPNNPTIFASCILPYAVIGLDWSYLDLTAATITGLPTDLTGLTAIGLRRPGGDFTGLVLDRANFANATLDGAHFTNAKLRRSASFAGARLIGALFTNAVLDQANFAGAALGGIAGTQAANFSAAWISNCNFTQANAYGVIFAGATLVSGNMLNDATNLQEADFSDAYLPYADFTGANLQGATFDGACMVECVLANADLTPAEQGAKAASFSAACLQGVDFTGTKLGGTNLMNAAITNGSGQFPVSHYDEYGNLTPPGSISWPAISFPSGASFSDATTCPNGSTYGSNQKHGLSIAQMMQAQSPPTQWTPRDSLRRIFRDLPQESPEDRRRLFPSKKSRRVENARDLSRHTHEIKTP
jgi:uncharacterized protein YjbI with pentapeptide repeats